MTTIIGVDFSGASSDKNTWVARGCLADDDELSFDVVHPIRRDDLYELLVAIPTPAVAALDFPFGVPAGFAAHLCGDTPPTAMPDVWQAVTGMILTNFYSTRNVFTDAKGEPKRAGDAYFPESFSPLKRVRPNMIPMTYEGIGLLHHWRDNYPQRFYVPPLEPPASADAAVTLLETMPGAFLRAVGLPYKGYKGGQHALELRDKILDGLAVKSGVSLPDLDKVRLACRANDDCLDAVVAAVGAAAWVGDCSRFRHPQPGKELRAAQLEGWIYAPLKA